MKADTFVYCLQEQARDAFAPIKVGIAKNVETRIINLQVGNPTTLLIRGIIGPVTKQQAQTIENDLHVRMSNHRIRGEWFSGRAIAEFETVRDEIGLYGNPHAKPCKRTANGNTAHAPGSLN